MKGNNLKKNALDFSEPAAKLQVVCEQEQRNFVGGGSTTFCSAAVNRVGPAMNPEGAVSQKTAFARYRSPEVFRKVFWRDELLLKILNYGCI
jgi:hypothetical protein